MSRAVKLLGLEHQSLIHILNTRHKRLAGKPNARQEAQAEHHQKAR
jgi:hypothetical protein